MFNTVVWRYGDRKLEEFDDLEDAVSFGVFGADEGDHKFECVIDENQVIVYVSESVKSYPNYQTVIGKKYIFD